MSLWQQHITHRCDAATCWYCQHPPIIRTVILHLPEVWVQYRNPKRRKTAGTDVRRKS